MADVIRTKDHYKLTLTLQNMEDDSNVVTRDLTFEVTNPISDSSAQKARFTAFRTTYMNNYANAINNDMAAVDPVHVGSLIQPSSFRDDVTTDESDQSSLYKCTDIAGAYIVTTERYFDINA